MPGNQRVTGISPEDKLQALAKYGRDLPALARQGKVDKSTHKMQRLLPTWT